MRQVRRGPTHPMAGPKGETAGILAFDAALNRRRAPGAGIVAHYYAVKDDVFNWVPGARLSGHAHGPSGFTIVHYSCGFSSSCCYLAIAMTATMCGPGEPSNA